MTLGYYHTAKKIIESLLNTNLPSQKYIRYIFYLKISNLYLSN